jgi:hypothetical protein
MESNWIDAVTGLYLASNTARLLAYVPQIRCLLHRDRRGSVSVVSCLLFAATHASTAIYAFAIQHNTTLALWAIGNLLPSLLIAALAARRQRDAGEKVLNNALNNAAAFYSAAFTSTSASREDRIGRGRRIDAAFFDAVTRNPRNTGRFQFRPFDLAARIGIRAARMKSAA